MTKLLQTILALAVAATISAPAVAKVYNYACNVPDEATGNKRLHPLRIDTAKHTITWGGSSFKNLKEGNVGGDCAKYCFQATRSNGDVAFISTATQGVANLMITYNRSGEAPIDEFDCDMIR